MVFTAPGGLSRMEGLTAGARANSKVGRDFQVRRNKFLLEGDNGSIDAFHRTVNSGEAGQVAAIEGS